MGLSICDRRSCGGSNLSRNGGFVFWNEAICPPSRGRYGALVRLGGDFGAVGGKRWGGNRTHTTQNTTEVLRRVPQFCGICAGGTNSARVVGLRYGRCPPTQDDGRQKVERTSEIAKRSLPLSYGFGGGCEARILEEAVSGSQKPRGRGGRTDMDEVDWDNRRGSAGAVALPLQRADTAVADVDGMERGKRQRPRPFDYAQGRLRVALRWATQGASKGHGQILRQAQDDSLGAVNLKTARCLSGGEIP